MSQYSFKRNAKVYIVSNGKQYNVDISEIIFSQDLADISTPVKTIQTQEMFAHTIAKIYQPATFQITFPALREADFQVLFDRALDYATFDLYIKNRNDLFKLEKCVITNTSFILRKTTPVTIDITGEASKLTREGDASTTIEGEVQSRSSSRTYNRLTYLEVGIDSVDNLDVLETLVSVNIELQNQIKWTPFNILEACGPETEFLYPTEFTVEKRILSGSIATHDEYAIDWDADATLYIKAGQEVGNDIYGFEFDLSNVAYTSRMTPGEIYTTHYDWRLTQNPESLLEIITYITTGDGDAHAILDFWGAEILDSNNLPILDSF
jgi:hypothetical protein